MTVTGRRSQIIGVYSPVGRCGKSSFAFTLGQVLAREEKVLYITLEEFSGPFGADRTVYTGGLSDLYYYTQREYSPASGQRDLQLGRPGLYSASHLWGGQDRNPSEVFAGLIQKIAADGAYEKLILDVGVFCGGQRSFLASAMWWVPVKTMGVYRKAGGMEGVSETVRAECIVGKLRFLQLPKPVLSMTRENYLEQLCGSDLGDFVRELG